MWFFLNEDSLHDNKMCFTRTLWLFMSSVYLLSDMMKKYPVPWSWRSKDAATSIHVHLSGNPSACLANVEFTLGSHSPGASNQMRVCPSSYYFSSGQGSSKSIIKNESRKVQMLRSFCPLHDELVQTGISIIHTESGSMSIWQALWSSRKVIAPSISQITNSQIVIIPGI